ncbi:MAG: isochorismate synthase [Urechidicola sp.]|nr:isochorismate synthase [Urechidicola sp.]
MKNLQHKIKESIASNIPFVLYRKPNDKINHSIFQNDLEIYEVYDGQEKGFVFAPFDNKETSLFIPFSKAEVSTFKINEFVKKPTIKRASLNSYNEREAHIELVQNGINFIKNSEAKKIVLSRKEVLKNTDFDCYKVYANLLNAYPTAFVYCWFHPISGLWMGATPERLLSICSNEFRVMALASTQEYKGSMDVAWGDKELQEHQFVVDYIASKFENQQIIISDTYMVRAGNLLHLRADISGVLPNSNSFNSLIESLHPTPATCGLPKEVAKKFILENEPYDRDYYTGYLGEIGKESTDLFVNLRCMKVESHKNKVSLFIGGGITKDSIPENEWLETVAKAKVMKRVL